jgi:thiol-disulfide isomerase/thioredoxin
MAGDDKILPDKDGRFKFILQVPFDLEFRIWHKKTYADLIIGAGDSLFVIINQNNTPSIVFSGNNSSFINEMFVFDKSNNLFVTDYGYLIEKSKQDTPMQYLFYRETKFKYNMDTIEKIFNKRTDANKLRSFYETSCRLAYCYDLLEFLKWYLAFQHVPLTKENIPDNYLFTIDSLFKLSANENSLDGYTNLLFSYAYITCFEIKDTFMKSVQSKNKQLQAKIKMDYYLKNFSGFQKDYLLTITIRNLINNSYISDEIFDKYHGNISMEFFNSFLNKKYYEYKLLQNADLDTNKVHLFDLTALDSTSLFNTLKANHTGKVLYVDVWATWCGSCINNFAYMSKLKKALSDYDIEYIYLAQGSPKKQWRKIIKNYKLEGYHYLLNRWQNRELNSKIQFQSIPHYFIMDDNGDIIVPSAKNPGDKELIKQIKTVIQDKRQK